MQYFKNKILLYGASGHAKVICSIFESMNVDIEGIFDDNKNHDLLNMYPIIGKYNNNYKPNFSILISIGNNLIRKKISQKISHKFAIAIHKSSIIDNITKIDYGSAIFQNTIIQRDVIIGMHCIINTNSNIDHESYINSFSSICPGVTICGKVNIRELTFIGANSTIIQGITVGKNCIVGAGTVVIKNVNETVK